jgi:hypothetical protein
VYWYLKEQHQIWFEDKNNVAAWGFIYDIYTFEARWFPGNTSILLTVLNGVAVVIGRKLLTAILFGLVPNAYVQITLLIIVQLSYAIVIGVIKPFTVGWLQAGPEIVSNLFLAFAFGLAYPYIRSCDYIGGTPSIQSPCQVPYSAIAYKSRYALPMGTMNNQLLTTIIIYFCCAIVSFFE